MRVLWVKGLVLIIYAFLMERVLAALVVEAETSDEESSKDTAASTKLVSAERAFFGWTADLFAKTWGIRQAQKRRRVGVESCTDPFSPPPRRPIEHTMREGTQQQCPNTGAARTIEPYAGMQISVSDSDDNDDGQTVTYELLQETDLVLGVYPQHDVIDYAYQPVGLGDEQDGRVFVRHPSEVSVLEGFYNRWWVWWFSLFRHFTNREHFHKYKMHEQAFAGGSHGDVWKGRQKGFDQPSLIFKRMRVGQGVRLLEAGLREIYFGTTLIASKYSSAFSKYRDHFFRHEAEDLELWIVFEDAGRSLRSYLYTGVLVGGLLLYQHSLLWVQVRKSLASHDEGPSSSKSDHDALEANTFGSCDTHESGRLGHSFIKSLLHQVLTSAAALHSKAIVHRDIKPSNILCRIHRQRDPSEPDEMYQCVLGDFSSAYNSEAARNLYTGGPSRKEQTEEYAPPEANMNQQYVQTIDPSFDSWSVGVVALELLLGTPNVFSVDQRTRAVLSHRLHKVGASESEIERAMYLAALSQYCIFNPSQEVWPLRTGDPLHNASMVKESCTLVDFERALRARDPLGLGFGNDQMLLQLVWRLLSFDPQDRLLAADALRHPYFADLELDPYLSPPLNPRNKALESQMLDPNDFVFVDSLQEFRCPKCQRSFVDWRSCSLHVKGRGHGRFCTYDKSSLPTCLNSHSMLPAHPSSGHCDIQGRRQSMEDFHAVQLLPNEQFYAIFDGHNGTFASKFVASTLYDELSSRLALIFALEGQSWREEIAVSVQDAFNQVHAELLAAGKRVVHGDMIHQSGTTATLALVARSLLIVASLGDSRAVVSSYVGNGTRQAIQLTRDHVAADDKERRLVEARGGKVITVNGLDRVDGTLMITRSFGDASLAHLLSREPEVRIFAESELAEVCGQELVKRGGAGRNIVPCFLIIASDGLWDTMTNEDAVDLVAETVSTTMDHAGSAAFNETSAFQNAAKALTLEAFVRGSSDNIGVCVIAL